MHITTKLCLALCTFAHVALSAYAADPAPTEVTLTRRADNGAYGTFAYSFRLATQDYVTHHNYVDLVFNGSGKLYINPVNGMSSRITDLGVHALGTPLPTPSPEATREERSISPQAGHLYLQEIKDERQSFAVEFLITEAGSDTLKLRWQPVDPDHQVLPLPAGKGAAGTMGYDAASPSK